MRTRLRLWFSSMLSRRRFDMDLDDEMAFHLRERSEQLQRDGVEPREAHRRARLEFGGRDKYKDQVRDVRRGVWVEQLRQDLGYGVRVLARRPGFTMAATLTLALGIGATATVFSLLEVVFLRPLPVRDPVALAHIYTSCRAGDVYCSHSYPEFLDYQSQSRAFGDMAAFQMTTVSVGETSGSWVADTLLVTTNYFSLLGIAPHAGQLLSPGWDVEAEPVAVVSHDAWVSRFGGDPAVIGQRISLSGATFRVVGVAPPGFTGTRLFERPDLWVPLANVGLLPAGGQLSARGTRWISGTIGRLRDGTSLAQAQSDMTLISEGLQASDPSRLSRFITVEPASRAALPPFAAADLTRFVGLLMGGVLATLFIACANIAGLLLARSSARRREFELRRSLGAGRGRIVRQLLAEYVLLAVAGTAGGLLVARGAIALLSAYDLPGAVAIASLDLGLSARVLAFSLLLLLVTTLFGLLPALGATRGLASTSSGRTTGEDGGTLWSQRLLLAAQVAVTVVLLFGAGLFIRSLQQGLALDLGLTTEQVVTIEVSPGLERYTPERTWVSIDGALARLAGLPGVNDVSLARFPPLVGGSGLLLREVEGYMPGPGEEIRIESNFVLPGYFSTLGVEILEGRALTDADREGTPAVAVVSHSMARRYWAGRSPIGLRIASPSFPQPVEIVGVARDVAEGLAVRPDPFVYLPLRQHTPIMSAPAPLLLLARVSGTPPSAGTLRDALRDVDPRLPVTSISTIASEVGQLLMPQRLGSALLSALAALTLTLVSVGIVGSVGYSVARRRHEIGVRLALGARRAQVTAAMTRGAVVPVVIGLVLGLGTALALSRFVAGFLYGIAPTDSLTSGVSIALLAIVAGVAAFVPAYRAAGVSPTDVLRAD